MLRRFCLLVAALSCLVPQLAFGQTDEALEAGEVFVKTRPVKGSEIPEFVVTGVVDAPPEKVFEVVGNCDRFAERMPRVAGGKILGWNGKTSAICQVTIDLPFPLSNLTSVTVDKRKLGPDEWSRRWSLRDTEADYHVNNGSYSLRPWKGNKNRTLLVYTIHAVPKTVIPDFLRERAQFKSLPKLVVRIREEVAKL